MNNKTLVIPGSPVAQKRPRFSRRLGRAFNSQSEIDNSITWHLASQWAQDALDCPVTLDLVFYVKIPASASKKRKAALQGQPCLKHCDVDNFLKKYLDCGNGVIYKDDAQVWKISARKVWEELDPRTEITVSW